MESGGSSLSVVLMGHSQAGKSVLGGRLGVEVRALSSREADKHERAGAGRDGARLAWLLDRTPDERGAGASRALRRIHWRHGERRMTLFVGPGAPARVRTMCRGLASADVGVLVVDAHAAELDQSLAPDGGMALDHVLLAYALGVPRLVVVVNKMDAAGIDFAAARFEEAKADVLKAVRKLGYAPDTVTVIPASGATGDNVASKSASMPWYKGPTLLELFESAPIPAREFDKPLRLLVRDVFKGNVSAGKIEQGRIKVGQVVTMAPRMITSTVQSIQIHGENVDEAQAGDIVGVTLKDVDAAELDRAAVIGDAKDPPRICAQFVARVQPAYLSKLKAGYSPLVVCHMGSFPCAFVRLLNKTDKKDKKKIIPNPEFIAKGESGLVLLVPLRPVCVDAFDNVPSLGRFAVRDNGMTRAVGKIQICTPQNSKKMLVIREHMHRLDGGHH